MKSHKIVFCAVSEEKNLLLVERFHCDKWWRDAAAVALGWWGETIVGDLRATVIPISLTISSLFLWYINQQFYYLNFLLREQEKTKAG